MAQDICNGVFSNCTVQGLNQRFGCLVSALLRLECRPFMVAGTRRIPCGAQIAMRLFKPISGPIHGPSPKRVYHTWAEALQSGYSSMG